jgi:hypothetical protein
MKVTRSRQALGGVALLACTALAGTLAPGAIASEGTGSAAQTQSGSKEKARLNALNNSGAFGKAVVHSSGRTLHVKVRAHRLAPGLPHAQHIHYGEEARNECPTAADAGGDFRLTTAEGVPAYGPVAVSLTTKGDTSPDSVLDVDRYPTAPDGHVHYERTTHTSREVARAIRQGEGVVVIHGVDYNGNGEYDFESAGASELNEELPAEATDPAVCGVLR